MSSINHICAMNNTFTTALTRAALLLGLAEQEAATVIYVVPEIVKITFPMRSTMLAIGLSLVLTTVALVL